MSLESRNALALYFPIQTVESTTWRQFFKCAKFIKITNYIVSRLFKVLGTRGFISKHQNLNYREEDLKYI